MKNNIWKEILLANGFTEAEIAAIEPFCDDFTKESIVNNPGEFIQNMWDYLNPAALKMSELHNKGIYKHDDAQFKQEAEITKAENDMFRVLLSKRGYSEDEIKKVVETLDSDELHYYQRMFNPDYLKYLDTYVKVDKPTDVENKEEANINNWINYFTQYGLSEEQIDVLKEKLYLNEDIKYKILLQAKEVLGLPNELSDRSLKFGDELKVNPNRIAFELKEDIEKNKKIFEKNKKDNPDLETPVEFYNGDPHDIVNYASVYAAAGYISENYNHLKRSLFSSSFEKNPYIKLEKRRKQLLDSGYSVEDVIFITMIGHLNSSDEVIAEELANSREYRTTHANDINELLNGNISAASIKSFSDKYNTYKKEKLVTLMQEKGYSEEQIIEIISKNSWNKMSLIENINFASDYYDKKTEEKRDEKRQKISEALSKVTAGVVAGTVVTIPTVGIVTLLNTTPLKEEIVTLVQSNPDFVALGGFVVAGTALLTFMGCLPSIVGYDIGGRTK